MSRTLVDLLSGYFEDPEPVLGCEVGVSCGVTSAALLKAFPHLSLVMVDSWEEHERQSRYRKSGDGHAKLSVDQQELHYRAALDKTAFAGTRRKVLRMRSEAAAGQLRDGQLDFVFIDGDHTYEGVRTDLHSFCNKVRPGGLMVGHDLDHIRDRRGLWGVRRAVEEFSNRVGEPFIGEGDLWWMVWRRGISPVTLI